MALTYTVPNFVAFTKIKSADVNSRFQDIKDYLNGVQYPLTNQTVAPATPAPGITSLFTDPASNLYTKNDAGKARPVALGNSVNYIVNPDAELDLTGWAKYSDCQVAAISIASPAVVTSAAPHGFVTNQAILFTTTGALPTGLVAGTKYFVHTIVDSTNYTVSATAGGADIDTSGSQSGVHTQCPLTPVTGTGGTASITLTRDTSAPVRGLASFLLTKDAAIRAGEGVSFDFSVSRADQGQSLAVALDYLTSGTFVSGASSDITVWLLDIANNTLLSITPGTIDALRGPYSGNATATLTGTTYRLILHVSTSSANAYTFKYDNVSVGPPPNVKLVPVQVVARASLNANQFCGGSLSIVNFQQTAFDSAGGMATGTYTVQVAGTYQIAANLNLEPASFTGYLGIFLVVNGANYAYSLTQCKPGDVNRSVGLSDLVKLSVGDVVQIGAVQNSGGALLLSADTNANSNWFSLARVAD